MIWPQENLGEHSEGGNGKAAYSEVGTGEGTGHRHRRGWAVRVVSGCGSILRAVGNWGMEGTSWWGGGPGCHMEKSALHFPCRKAWPRSHRPPVMAQTWVQELTSPASFSVGLGGLGEGPRHTHTHTHASPSQWHYSIGHSHSSGS